MERKGILGHPGKKVLLLCAQPCTVNYCYWPSGPRVSTYTYVGTYEWKFIKGAVHMIQEWLAFRIDFHSRMKLWCIHMIKPNRSTKGVLARVFFTPAIFNPAERSPFSVNMKPEKNFVPERKFHSEWKPEWLVRGENWWKKLMGMDELVLEWKRLYHVKSP